MNAIHQHCYLELGETNMFIPNRPVDGMGTGTLSLDTPKFPSRVCPCTQQFPSPSFLSSQLGNIELTQND